MLRFTANLSLGDRYYNVQRYGAVGDGTTDDYASIQAAINAAETNSDTTGSGVVVFPPGVYKVSQTLVISNNAIVLIGTGTGQDNAPPATNTGPGAMIVPAGDFANGTYVLRVGTSGSTAPLGGVRIYGLRISENTSDTLQNTVHGIYFKCYRGFLQDVWVEEMTGDGIVFQGRGAGEGGNWNTYETKLHNCHFRRNDGSGIVLYADTADMHFTDVLSHGNGEYGIEWLSGASHHFVSCHIHSNGHGGAGTLNNVYITGTGSRSKFIGCKFENPGGHNFFVDCTSSGVVDLHVLGCNFNSAGAKTDNTYDNFIIYRASGGDTCSGVLVGCSFQWTSTSENGGVRKPRYHLNLTPAAADFHASELRFDANAQTAAFDLHANAKFCTVNGLGKNSGNPGAAGNWFTATANQLQEGQMVVDTAANVVYIYANGAWRALN